MRIVFEEDEHLVVGLSGSAIRLRSDAGVVQLVLLAELLASTGFEVLTEVQSTTATKDTTALLEAVGSEELATAEAMQSHLAEMATGYRSGDPDEALETEPRPEYDPSLSLAVRVKAKAKELEVGERSLWRKYKKWQELGLFGLVDQRKARLSNPLAGVDKRIVTAILEQDEDETGQSTGTQKRFRRRVQARLDREFGEGTVPLPPPATFSRYVRLLLAGRHTFGPATTRRTNNKRPGGPYRVPSVLRPGELVLMDTTRLDVLAIDGITGATMSVELTLAMDLGTRSILAWRITPVGTKSVDAVLMLADALTPEAMRPSWPSALEYRFLRLPVQRVMELDARLHEAAARPVIWPETVVVDNGSIFVSRTFADACQRLGITIQLARKGQPTDKAQVERIFGSIRTMFSEHLAGYKAQSVAHRGQPEAHAMWTIEDLEELFAEFVVAVWQRRRHDGLVLPGFPEIRLSPNEAYAESITRSGVVICPPSKMLYVELLPVHWRVINPYGVEINGLTYDGVGLNDYRRARSPYTQQRGLWPIRLDPRDISHAYFCDPTTNEWSTLRWVHALDGTRPFSDVTSKWVRSSLAARGEEPPDQEAVADALLKMQNRMDLPGALQARERMALARDFDRARQANLDAAGVHDDGVATELEALPAFEDHDENDELEEFTAFNAQEQVRQRGVR